MFRLNMSMVILFLTSVLSAQPSEFIPYACTSYSVDPFTGDLYLDVEGEPIVLKVNPNTKEFVEMDLPSVPAFANKSHIGVVHDFAHKRFYLYDFETNTKTLLLDSASVSYWQNLSVYLSNEAFSPNDKKLVLGDIEYNFSTGKVYEPSTLNSRQFSFWNTDTSLIISRDPYTILQYYPDSRKVDTLIEVQKGSYDQITSISYNNRLGRIFYATNVSLPLSNKFIHFYDLKTHMDSIIYDMKKSEAGPLFAKQFTSLSWSPDQKMLGFIGLYSTQSDADLYVYHTDSNKVFMLTNVFNNAGRKDRLNWLDNKKLIYRNLTLGHLLYTYALSSELTDVKSRKSSPSECNLLFNYPNPFNSSTIISFTTPENSSSLELLIYNTLGQKVKTYRIGEYQKGSIHKLQWNGTDDNSSAVSSGIYYAVFNTDSKENNKIKPLKLILIK